MGVSKYQRPQDRPKKSRTLITRSPKSPLPQLYGSSHVLPCCVCHRFLLDGVLSIEPKWELSGRQQVTPLLVEALYTHFMVSSKMMTVALPLSGVAAPQEVTRHVVKVNLESLGRIGPCTFLVYAWAFKELLHQRWRRALGIRYIVAAFLNG